MATLRDGSKENRESFEKAEEKHAAEHAAEAHEHKDNVDIEHAEHKDARYDNEAFENEKKDFEGQ